MPVDELLSRRVARAALEVAGELEVVGSVVRRRTDWPGSAQEWSDAAAAAEIALQRPVASGFSRRTGSVWVTLLDWPRSAEELTAAARQNRELSARLGGAASTVEPGAAPVAGATTT